MKSVNLSITTNGSGAATVTAPTSVTGRLYAVVYRPGTIATGATITVTSEGSMSRALLTKANAGTADSTYYPRAGMHAVTDGSALTLTTGSDTTMVLLDGKPQVVVASGGATASGELEVFYLEN
jgi:hypothetical protein